MNLFAHNKSHEDVFKVGDSRSITIFASCYPYTYYPLHILMIFETLLISKTVPIKVSHIDIKLKRIKNINFGVLTFELTGII